MLEHTRIVLATSAFLIFASQPAGAGSVSEVKFQDIVYAGDGCPVGSAYIVLAPDKKSVSVLFKDYVAAAGGNGQRDFDRKKCDIAFSLEIPSGISVSFDDADYYGFTDLPSGAQASFKRDYFFADSRGSSLTKSWSGPQNGDFHVKDSVNVWSDCGANVILRSKNSVIIRSDKEASVTLRTVHRYNFRYRTCH